MKTADLRDKLKNFVRAQVNSSLRLTFGVLGPRPTMETAAKAIMTDLEAIRIFSGAPVIRVDSETTSVRETKHVSAVRYSLKITILRHADKFGQMPVKIDGSNKLIFA